MCVEDVEGLLAHCLRREALPVGALEIEDPQHLLSLCKKEKK
jgi:hypothetical protein